MSTSPNQLEAELHRQCNTLSARGFDVRGLVFEPPAAEAEVEALEAALGTGLPTALRRTLLQVSRHVEFRWFAPRGLRFPEPFGDSFCGDLHWSLEFIRQFEEGRRSWAAEVFGNPADPYDAVWHNKLAFYEVGNGDYLAIDLAEDRRGAIIYLSHDDGEAHGYTLARDFDDLLARWVPLACTGGEYWQWTPFVDEPRTGINPNSPNGQLWRSLLRI